MVETQPQSKEAVRTAAFCKMKEIELLTAAILPSSAIETTQIRSRSRAAAALKENLDM